jgi:hypothetical protein
VTTSPLAGELKKYLIRMIAAVAVLDAVAIAAYYGLHVGGMVPRRQAMFAGAWTVITLAVVLSGLTRIRTARQRARRQRG